MPYFDPSEHPHRRLNPLTDEYVLVSPHRTKRPWLGQTEAPQISKLEPYDPNCYLCPGNTRSSGHINPQYNQTHTFENDFAAVLPYETSDPPHPPHPLLTTEPVQGYCDVIIFHPRHDLTLARLPKHDMEQVIEEWIRIYISRGSQEGIKYVQIFENKGSIMGCSNPHPHGQVWSISSVPTIPAKELESLKRYSTSVPSSSGGPKNDKGLPCLLCDYAHAEISLTTQDSRLVIKNDHWVALVPWWATWPFEILVLPYKRHISSISDLDATEKSAFADILSRITKRYDNLFSCSFAYSMGLHQRPVPQRPANGSIDGCDDDIAHLHLHFTPPLLRNASIRKFLVGFELMAEAQRDLTPEKAASMLRACSETHYLALVE